MHPIFQRILDTAPHAPHVQKPVLCRKCETPLITTPIDQCCQLEAIRADLALNENKAHRKNNEDFARALMLQAQQMDCMVLS